MRGIICDYHTRDKRVVVIQGIEEWLSCEDKSGYHTRDREWISYKG